MAATAGMKLPLRATGLLLLAAQPAAARDVLGVWQGWAAFRDAAPPRCYAITRPIRAGDDAALSVARFPPSSRAELRVWLSRAAAGPVTLRIGRATLRLPVAGREARARTPRADGQVVAAMRAGTLLTVEGRDARGRPFRDAYRLAGAASAVDAALIGCIP